MPSDKVFYIVFSGTDIYRRQDEASADEKARELATKDPGRGYLVARVVSRFNSVSVQKTVLQEGPF